MANRVFKRQILYRISAYLLILPFIPAIRPIMNRHSTVDLIIFLSGFVLTILLIIYNNNKAYIKISDKKLLIFLLYRHKPEIHHFSSIERVVKKSPVKLTMVSRGFDPLEIHLSKKEQLFLLQIFEENEIPVSTAYRS